MKIKFRFRKLGVEQVRVTVMRNIMVDNENQLAIKNCELNRVGFSQVNIYTFISWTHNALAVRGAFHLQVNITYN